MAQRFATQVQVENYGNIPEKLVGNFLEYFSGSQHERQVKGATG